MIYSNLVAVAGVCGLAAVSGATFSPQHQNSFLKAINTRGKYVAAKDIEAKLQSFAASADKYCGAKSYYTSTSCSGSYDQADYFLLNTCIVDAGVVDDGSGAQTFDSFEIVAATVSGTTTVLRTFYSDDACTTPVSALEFTADDGCNAGTEDSMYLVCQSSTPSFSSGLVTSIYDEDGCPGDAYSISYIKSGTCMSYGSDGSGEITCQSGGASYSNYTTYDCTGTAEDTQTLPSSMFGCSAADDDYTVYYFSDTPGGYTTYSCSTGGSSDDSSCFGANEMIQLENGATKPISEIKVGDRVLISAANGEFKYSDVVFVPHGANNDEATFVTLHTKNGKSLTATKGHLVVGGDCSSASVSANQDLAAIESLAVDECVLTVDGMDRIVSSESFQGRGVYTVVAADTNGKLVVNGVVASSFAVNHAAANTFYHAYRMAYNVLPGWMTSELLVTATAAFGVFAAGFSF